MAIEIVCSCGQALRFEQPPAAGTTRCPACQAIVTVDAPDPSRGGGDPPATADFELASGGRIHGLVRDARSRAPVPGAEIEVEGEVDLGPSALPVRALATAGPDGAFELRGVPPGPVSLYASAEGHHARIVSGLQVAEGDRVEKGQGVVVVMAMKMEATIGAPYPGRVVKINVAKGDKVMPGQILVEIEKEGEEH